MNFGMGMAVAFQPQELYVAFGNREFRYPSMRDAYLYDVSATHWPLVLNVVIQGELVGMRPQAHSVGLVFSLISDKSFEQFFAENVAFKQESMILFETRKCFLERC